MRILIALTYYRPHVSGVTIYAERLARGLARRGHEVTVLTSRFSPSLPAGERIDGVEVVRVPIWAKVSKGVIMPSFPAHAARLIRSHDAVNVHMPQFEAAPLAALGRLCGRRVVLTYHCDIQLPAGAFNKLVQASLIPLNAVAAGLAHDIVINTADYGRQSAFLSRFAARLRAVLPPIEATRPAPEATAEWMKRRGIDGSPRIGFAARFAAEKGVEHLLAALPEIVSLHPETRLFFTGACEDTVGEEAYRRRLDPLIDAQRDRLVFLDLLADDEMPLFFSSCDVLAVTSLNSTESFGLVQAEAMSAGTPVVATDLPGVREAVRLTGMGALVPPGDPGALAATLLDVIADRSAYVRAASEVRECFSLDATLHAYEELLSKPGRAG